MNILVIHSTLDCLDGVSIESNKYVKIFESLGHTVFRIAGKFGNTETNRGLTLPDIISHGKEIENDILLLSSESTIELKILQAKLCVYAQELKIIITKFIKDNNIDILSVDNVFSLPLCFPLTVALSKIILESGIPCIARHHDFYWDRNIFSHYPDILSKELETYFPPKLDSIQHIVINKKAEIDLNLKKGIKAMCLYNSFELNVSISKRDLAHDLRIQDNIIFLQPSRVVRRKNIELSIEFIASFNKNATKKGVLVITGNIEEINEYHNSIIQYAEQLDVRLVFLYDQLPNGGFFPTEDIYNMCDVVIFPSHNEGFGNPIIESVLYKKVLVTNAYPVLKEVLEYGFDFIVLNDNADQKAIIRLNELLDNTYLLEKMHKLNYAIVKKHFSMESLNEILALMLIK